jgi:hypothetical protein
MLKLLIHTLTVSLQKVKGKSSDALLRILLVCIRSYLKSVLDTYHPATLYLREEGCEDSWLFFKAKRGSRTKKFGKHSSKYVAVVIQHTMHMRRIMLSSVASPALPHSSTSSHKLYNF